jgi:hypothetical protein
MSPEDTGEPAKAVWAPKAVNSSKNAQTNGIFLMSNFIHSPAVHSIAKQAYVYTRL